VNCILLKDVESSIAIFFASAGTACIIEYATSYIMEKLFAAKWWDYSHFPFNLNGRICLYGGLVFGGGSLIIVKYIHPFVISILKYIPEFHIGILSLSFTVILIIDTILAVNSMNRLNKKLKRMYDAANGKADVAMEVLTDKARRSEDNILVEKGKVIIVKVQNVNSVIKSRELRFLEAFPDVKFPKYGISLDVVLRRLIQKNPRKQNEEDFYENR